jgi:hypothetical protein
VIREDSSDDKKSSSSPVQEDPSQTTQTIPVETDLGGNPTSQTGERDDAAESGRLDAERQEEKPFSSPSENPRDEFNLPLITSAKLDRMALLGGWNNHLPYPTRMPLSEVAERVKTRPAHETVNERLLLSAADGIDSSNMMLRTLSQKNALMMEALNLKKEQIELDREKRTPAGPNLNLSTGVAISLNERTQEAVKEHAAKQVTRINRIVVTRIPDNGIVPMPTEAIETSDE